MKRVLATYVVVCMLVSSVPAFAQSPSDLAGKGGSRTDITVDTEGLKPEVQMSYAEELNQIYGRYNPQISAAEGQLKGAYAKLATCPQLVTQAEAAGEEAEEEAKDQAKQNMMEPAANTLGKLLEAGMGMGSGESQMAKDQLAAIQQTIQNDPKLSMVGQGGVTTSANLDMECKKEMGCTASATGGTTNPQCMMMVSECKRSAEGRADKLNQQLQAANTKKAESGSAMGELIGAGMQLAAAGMGAAAMHGKGEKAKERLITNGEAEKANCEAQAKSDIANAQSQIDQLNQAKARDLIMANMRAQYMNNLPGAENPEEDGYCDESLQADPDCSNQDPTLGGSPPVFVGDRDFDPGSDTGEVGGGPILQQPGGDGGAAPAGGGGGGSSGGGVGDPKWTFGGSDSGPAGGGGLPPQPEGAGWGGTAGGGFGKNPFAGLGLGKDKDGAGAGEGPAPAGEDGSSQVLGDGGLNLMLTRARMRLVKHSATLVKSVDMKKMAQGLKKPSDL